jgi:hypothetical protein
MPTKTRDRRGLTIALFFALSIAAPALVFASHQFTDVPNGGFHTDITRVAGAGITAGCTATTYCPQDPVSRGQMAAFLNRVGGRAAYDSNGFVTGLNASSQALASVTIRAGNVPGGTAFIHLEASGYAYTDAINETNCAPCLVTFRIDRVGGGSSPYSFFSVHNFSATLQDSATGSISWVVEVPTAVDQTFDLQAARYSGTGALTGLASLTAEYVPFGPTGGNSLIVAGSGAAPFVGDSPVAD